MIRSLLLLGLGLTAGLALLLDPGTSNADDAGETGPTILMEPEITWAPERPGEGSLFRVRVVASRHTPLIGAHGVVAGEELHFRREESGAFESLAAVPVGADGSVDASFRFVYEAGPEERLSLAIPIERGTYDHEELSVAPRFGSPLGPEDRARLARDREKSARASATAHRTPRLWGDSVVIPRSGRVTSGFGDGRIFNGRVSSRHMGLDLQGATGDTVVAAARGVVSLVEPFLLAGNVVYLNHGGGLLSAYFHLSEQLVAVGDTVEVGDPVGRIGATGRVTGPHLHWVVRYGTTSVDPRSLLSLLDQP